MSVLLFEKRDRIAFLTLNRPAALNAINPELHERLCAAWDDIAGDDGIDVAIITGAGDDAFCAGADLKEFVPPLMGCDPTAIRDLVPLGLGGLTRGLHWMAKPVIAAVNGWALSGGFETALAADIRIASENAKFGSFEARRGFHHGDGGIPRLVNSCGLSFAMEMLLTAEPIDAERARQVNLVSRVVPHRKLMEEAELVARQILRNDQVAVRSAKATILDMIGRSLDDQLRLEAINGYTCMSDAERVRPLLEAFYSKTDKGRAGRNATPL
ncbi:MAG: enoyl-CoA hydratase/isomerase family protein [Alphaproteobacteria bacterium]|nr:enoyl-CoA hydratase/isomerase family protein [Alphaproteobacteria bacterium]